MARSFTGRRPRKLRLRGIEMKTPARIAVVLLGAMAALVALLAFRTATYRPPVAVDVAGVNLAEGVPVDQARAARHLSEAVRIRTVSHQDPSANDWSEWQRFRDWLQATYPETHRELTLELVAGHTLVYTWAGSDPALPPIVLMAHHDVVPVTPGTEDHWAQAPFDGVIADGAVWGRGSVDDKSSLVGMFEAVEALVTSGFTPLRTVIILSGHDEEAGGSGVRTVAGLWRERGVAPAFALDEGLAIVEDFSLLGRPVALIGVAEKGYATLRVTAPAKGGHSSAPPPETGVEVLARAILAITSRPFEPEFSGPVADMLRTLAPHAGLAVRMAVANAWLFEPLLVKQIAATPAGAAMLHTTIAPTMLRGSPKENVLPQDATAWINYRIAPGQTTAEVIARAEQATRGLGVELEWEGAVYDPPPVSSAGSEAFRIIAALASDGGTLPVAPGLVTATTDSRSLAGIAQDVYRFQPFVASMREFEMIHGTNERLTLENLERLTGFYSRLIATAAAR
jgi:carboxypeptidase PM20D1